MQEAEMGYPLNEWGEKEKLMALSNGGGLRYNEGKLRYDLIPPEWIKLMAEVLTKGAEKYEPRNWEKGMDWSKCYASLMRHIQAWYAGEDNDPETGLSHLGHAAWNALALYTYSGWATQFDDRPIKDKPQYEIERKVPAPEDKLPLE